MSLRLDPEQRFTCAQCGKCCRGWDVIVSDAEIDLYRKRNAAAWFTGDADPFEPVPGLPHLRRIGKRADGACGFLSSDNKCRIHQELGGAKKPLTCRLFPYAFHTAATGAVVTASFSCPTIVANEGAIVSAGEPLKAIEALRAEWFSNQPPTPMPALELVKGRTLDTRSLLMLRQHLTAMLKRDSNDVRGGVRRVATLIDDLTRSRVLALADDDFAEYLKLTVPHAAATPEAPPTKAAGPIGRMLQYGFLYTVAAIRVGIERPDQSRTQLRLQRLQLLAHFHGLAPGLAGLNVNALKRQRLDFNDPAIRPIAFHYLRSTLETMGSSGRPIVDELAIAVSYLNAAMALAAMNADAAGTDVDRTIFIDALTKASDASHARHRLLDWVLGRFSGGSGALWKLAESGS